MSFVFLDIVIGKSAAKQIVFELFFEDLPKTCENFRALCTGEKSNASTKSYIKIKERKLHYKGTKFHRMVRNFMA
jgi:cyclophilin family peptidyl-prolyl cis-trans isomerase